ncbi:MAG: hypothetical protein ACFFAN_16800 [Promethearchaeota archaeon]
MVLKGVYPIVKDEIVDFNGLEKLMHYILQKNLCVDPSDHPLIFVEPPLCSRRQREKICEIVFETFKIPALLLVDAALADLSSTGKRSGLVIRLKDLTYIVPIIDSLSLSSYIKKNMIGIGNVSSHLRRFHNKAGHSFIISREVIKDIQDKLCYVALEPDKESCKKTYILPNGDKINLENELFLAPEIYFKPKMIGKESEINPLDIEVYDTLMKVEDDFRHILAKNIVLSGTKIHGMKERLQRELEKLAKFPIEIVQAEPNSSWVGASLIGSLSSIKYPSKHWITRKEYYESGPIVSHSKARSLFSGK